MNTKTIAPPDLCKLNELAKVHALSYASPHHFTMSVNGLREVIAELQPPAGNKMALDALTACPFCGKSNTLIIGRASDVFAEPDECGDPMPYMHTESYAVTCDASKPDGPGGCGASGGYKFTEAEAVSAWNARAAIAALQAEPQPALFRDLLTVAEGLHAWCLAQDTARYQLLRRGQKWSVVDGIGTVLRAETLDAAIDNAMAKD